MNELIAEILASRLIALPFVTKSAGLIHDLRLSGGKDKPDRVFAASNKVYSTRDECDNVGAYTDLIPVSSETGISYFEAGDEKLTNRGAFDIVKGELTLVAWFNRSDICQKLNVLDPMLDIRCAFQNLIEKDLLTQGSILQGKIKIIRNYGRNKNPFKRFSYDEKQRQFLIHPFDYFSAKIEYNIYANCNCGSVYDTSVEDEYIRNSIDNIDFVRIYNEEKTDGIY